MDPATIAAIAAIVSALMPYIIQGVQYFIENILPLIIAEMKKNGMADKFIAAFKNHLMGHLSKIFTSFVPPVETPV